MWELSWVVCALRTMRNPPSSGLSESGFAWGSRTFAAVCCATLVWRIANRSAFCRVVCAEIPHNGDVAATGTPIRQAYVIRGQRLEYVSIAYNSLEGLASIVAGLIAGSVSLVGFGLDSMIEVASGAALLWRLRRDLEVARREHAERAALRTVGVCFVALALYILYECISTLIRHVPPERSIVGIVIACVSVIVMPVLARAKRRVAGQICSGAMRADSRQADFCAYLSAILLGGLLLNALFGWRWTDPVAGFGDGSDHRQRGRKWAPR